MKKIIITSILTVSLFFCFFTKVNADTITFSISDWQLDLAENVPTMLNTIANKNYSNYRYIIVAYRRYSNNPWEYLFVHQTSGDRPYLYYLTSWNDLAYYNPYNYVQCFSSDFTSLGSCSYYSGNYANWTGYSNYLNPDSINQLVYSSPSAVLNSDSPVVPDTYVFTHEDRTFNYDANSGDPAPTLYTLREYFNASPPTPPDDTPLLTSFVNVVLDKLTLTTDFFTSSYIYLSIFVIIIFYFSICLLRRFTK